MKIMLYFTSRDEPHIAEVILETEAKIKIDRASIDAVKGEVLITVPREKLSSVLDAFKKRGVDAKVLEHPVLVDENKCMRCGACISVCPTNVFKFKDDWQLDVEEGKCFQCSVCVTVCPFNAIEIPS